MWLDHRVKVGWCVAVVCLIDQEVWEGLVCSCGDWMFFASESIM